MSIQDIRLAIAPLTNTQSHPDGSLSDEEHRWLMRRAEGGFPWISTCAAFVSPEGKAWAGQLGIASDAHMPGLSRLASDMREAGTPCVVQLHHAGAKASLAPKQRLSTADDEGVCGATESDIERVIGDFVAAAQRAEHAGLAGVEIHGANGYIFTQFLAPDDNPRTDAYGGSLENRARFLRQTMRAVRAAVSNDFHVGVRLSPVDVWNRRGLILADGVQVGLWLAEDGADFIHLSLSKAWGAAPHEPDSGPVARAFREALPVEVPVFAAGGIWTAEDAQRAYDAGVDVAVLGRASIAHPDWPRVSSQEGWTPMRPPWTEEALREVDVSEAFVHYLSGMSGMVVGGNTRRGG